MHFSSADTPSPRDGVLIERRAHVLNRFDDRIPVIYRQPIDLHEDIANWIAGWGGGSLFLTGSIGVGKTHTAWHTCRRWLQAQYAPGEPWQGSPLVKTYRSTALFDALRPDAPGGEGRSLVHELQECDLLFIDDLAAAKASTWTQERLFELFDERYINRRPVIITCDVLPNELSEVTGPRVASRLAEMCRNSVVLLEGDDRRTGAAA
ncbi:DnaA ATPase domain-containing protein [Streptomyces malaysiensis]|uniref:DnaA/Hda family protein n=1 Tax=Streptomyces malaysiensis subsp. samsunensis TaxID=459658 RepID=A0A9X2LWE7_STRMQ|nr:DnaA/Hda family protein [Streptomyces samsunensis]MCQ8831830.1 DnaA/Hda family protein [Streptomyces samsunensis]